MSLPAALSGHLLNTVASISPLDGFLQIFNSNPYFIGVMMLILNLGGRFISLEITKNQEQFLQLPWVRRVLIFTVLFVATRNIWVAFWTTVTVVLLLGYLFNENSALCVFGYVGKDGSTCSKTPEQDMTPEEKEILLRLSAKAQKYQVAKNPQQLALEKEKPTFIPHTNIYSTNLSILQNL